MAIYCQQVRVNAGLLEAWSKRTTDICTTDINIGKNDDSGHALLWF